MESPLRFCMVTTFYPPYSFGGDAIFVRRLANELAERGHEVDVIHCIDSYRLLAGGEPERVCGDHPNVTVHGLRSPLGRLSPFASQQTGLPLFKSARIREVMKKGFDVIHYHNISLFGPGVLEYGRAVKLYTMHEYWLVCPTHVLFKFNRVACTEPSCFKCNLSYRRPPQWWRYTGLLENSVRHVDAFIAQSRFGKEAHQRMKLDIPLVDLPGFVPSAPVADEPTVEPQPSPYFLFVGRLEKLKGLQTLIPVFRRSARANLLIAGAGSYEPQLRQLAEGSSNIRFLGHLAEPQLNGLYRRAVALIVPSLCYEVFPLVIPEAFRQQTPVIARNIGGLPEIVRESEGGLLYDSEGELVAAIDDLLADTRYRDEMGLRGYQAYQRNWTVEAHLERYFALIHKVSAKNGDVKGRS
ncbi:MAG TPA: glycosyltransferase family 4 protein [Blastocatellia bacterium]|nr:glycosyltransferase family 4 protein [Blastocatellia bacterium]